MSSVSLEFRFLCVHPHRCGDSSERFYSFWLDRTCLVETDILCRYRMNRVCCSFMYAWRTCTCARGYLSLRFHIRKHASSRIRDQSFTKLELSCTCMSSFQIQRGTVNILAFCVRWARILGQKFVPVMYYECRAFLSCNTSHFSEVCILCLHLFLPFSNSSCLFTFSPSIFRILLPLSFDSSRGLSVSWLCLVCLCISLYSGMVAGFMCKLVEYPLDTIKVQVQTQAANGPQMSPIAMLTKSVKEEGFLGLYRGIPSPLLGSMVENSVLFASYGLATRSLHTGDPETIPFGLKLVAGGFSGACVATVLTPVELIKCKMQTTNISAVRYKSSGECLAATLKSGGIRALFHGHVGTLCRELPGNAGAPCGFTGYVRTRAFKNRSSLSARACVRMLSFPFSLFLRPLLLPLTSLCRSVLVCTYFHEYVVLFTRFRLHVDTRRTSAAWFGGYELGLMLQTPVGGSRSDIGPLGLMGAGALGGMAYWGVPFPFDVVKSKIQTGTHGMPEGSKINVVSVLKHVAKVC